MKKLMFTMSMLLLSMVASANECQYVSMDASVLEEESMAPFDWDKIKTPLKEKLAGNLNRVNVAAKAFIDGFNDASKNVKSDEGKVEFKVSDKKRVQKTAKGK